MSADQDFYRSLLTQEEKSDEFTASAEHILKLKAKGEQDELRREQEKTANALAALKDPAILPFVGSFAAAAPILSYLSTRPKEEHGGRSSGEAYLDKVIEDQKSKPETGFAQKIHHRNTELSRGLAQAYREHPVQSSIAAALLGAGVGAGVGTAAGAVKNILLKHAFSKVALTMAPGAAKSALGGFLSKTPQLGAAKGMLGGAAIGAAGGALTGTDGDTSGNALRGAVLGAAGGYAAHRGASALAGAGRNMAAQGAAKAAPAATEAVAHGVGLSAAPSTAPALSQGPMSRAALRNRMSGASSQPAGADGNFLRNRLGGEGGAAGATSQPATGDALRQRLGGQPAAAKPTPVAQPQPQPQPQQAQAAAAQPSAQPAAAPDVSKTQFGHTPGSPSYQAARSAQDAAREEVQIAHRLGKPSPNLETSRTVPDMAAANRAGQHAAIDQGNAGAQDLAARMGMGPQSRQQVAQAIGQPMGNTMQQAEMAAAKTMNSPAPRHVPGDATKARMMAELPPGALGKDTAPAKKVINGGAAANDAHLNTMAGGPPTAAGAPSGPTGTQMHPTPHTQVGGQAQAPAKPATNMFQDESIHNALGAPSTTPQEAQSIMSRIRSQDPAAAAQFEQQYAAKMQGGQMSPAFQQGHHRALALGAEGAAQGAMARGGRLPPSALGGGQVIPIQRATAGATAALGKQAGVDFNALGSFLKVAQVIRYINERYGHV